jgi:hypothetical protein
VTLTTTKALSQSDDSRSTEHKDSFVNVNKGEGREGRKPAYKTSVIPR